MENSIAINEQKLWPEFHFLLQSVKQCRVHWNFFKCEETRDVRVRSGLCLIVLINYLHLRICIDYNVSYTILLISFAVTNIDCCNSLQRVGLAWF